MTRQIPRQSGESLGSSNSTAGKALRLAVTRRRHSPHTGGVSRRRLAQQKRLGSLLLPSLAVACDSRLCQLRPNGITSHARLSKELAAMAQQQQRLFSMLIMLVIIDMDKEKSIADWRIFRRIRNLPFRHFPTRWPNLMAHRPPPVLGPFFSAYGACCF